MKQGKPLQRKTPLQRGASPLKRTPMKRSQSPMKSSGLQRKAPWETDADGNRVYPDKPKQSAPLTRKTPLQSNGGLPRRKEPLRQGTGLKRSGGLKPGSGLKQGTGLQRGKPLTSTTAPTTKKPMKRSAPKVTAAERATRKLVEARSGGICEICGSAPATDKAHRVSRETGAWAAHNILDACRRCHSYNHANPAEAYEKGQHLQSWRDPAKEAVFFHHDGKRDWAVLDEEGGFSWI